VIDFPAFDPQVSFMAQPVIKMKGARPVAKCNFQIRVSHGAAGRGLGCQHQPEIAADLRGEDRRRESQGVESDGFEAVAMLVNEPPVDFPHLIDRRLPPKVLGGNQQQNEGEITAKRSAEINPKPLQRTLDDGLRRQGFEKQEAGDHGQKHHAEKKCEVLIHIVSIAALGGLRRGQMAGDERAAVQHQPTRLAAPA